MLGPQFTSYVFDYKQCNSVEYSGVSLPLKFFENRMISKGWRTISGDSLKSILVHKFYWTRAIKNKANILCGNDRMWVKNSNHDNNNGAYKFFKHFLVSPP